MDKQLLLGDEAIAQAALDAGLSGVYAYPGTPSTELLNTFRLFLETLTQTFTVIGAPTKKQQWKQLLACRLSAKGLWFA
jgi:indolepyruvate ferredoxin oxidoreductase alpha subunit